MKKPPQKVAYLSKNSVVSEISLLLPNSPNGRILVPMWPIEQLYMELGVKPIFQLIRAYKYCNISMTIGWTIKEKNEVKIEVIQ